jgi:hypothetical protein
MIRKVETGLPTRIIFTKKVGMPSSQLDSMRQSRQADGLQRLATGAADKRRLLPSRACHYPWLSLVLKRRA